MNPNGGKVSGNMKREIKDLLVEINLDYFRVRFIKYTRKAFQMLPKLKKPRILDIGCGSGLPTIELAKLSDGEVIGIDIAPSELDRLDRKIKEEDLSSRVKTVKCSVLEMDFPDESFDIVWAEGVIRIMGFKKSLKEWHRLLKSHGFLVVHDAINLVLNKLKGIPNWGYKLVDFFRYPKTHGGQNFTNH